MQPEYTTYQKSRAALIAPTRSETLKSGVLLRSDIVLALEQLVRNELILQRLLAASRREASARGAALRQKGLVAMPMLPIEND